MGYELIDVTAGRDWQDYHALRRKVLWEQRGLENYDEDNADEYSPWRRSLHGT